MIQPSVIKTTRGKVADLMKSLGIENPEKYLAPEFGPPSPDPITGNSDPVINPPHYARYKIQPLEFILANDLPYPEGNVIKYVCRWRYKNGVEDLRKARNYIDQMIAEYEKR